MSLREKAEAATPGPWTCDKERPRWITTAGEILIDEADWGQPDNCHLMQVTTVADERAWRYADVAFIAAADPPTVLALLDENAALWELVDAWNAYDLSDESDPDEFDALATRLIDAQRRVAELEAQR